MKFIDSSQPFLWLFGILRAGLILRGAVYMSENAVKTVKGILLTVLAFMSTMVMSQQVFGATNAQVQAFIKNNRAAVMAVSNEYGIYPSNIMHSPKTAPYL